MLHRKFQHGLIAKAIAWSMVVALIVHPLGLIASSCNCRNSVVDSAPPDVVELSSCCSKQSAGSKSCDANDQCMCGDNCHCVGESSKAPVSAPLPTESNSNHNSAVVAVYCWPSNNWNVDDSRLTRAADQWFADARTAQQTCTLLSRFNC